MGNITDLVKAVAQIEGIDEVSVGVYARHAREAGLISSQGRGRHAANKTVSDATNLLIAVNASPLAKDVPDTIRRYRSLGTEAAFPSNLLDPLVAEGGTFGSVLEKAIEWCFTDAEGRCRMQTMLDAAHLPSARRLSKRAKVELSPASFTISFDRPVAEVRMGVWVPQLYRQNGKLITSQFEWNRLGFSTESVQPSRSDRRDTTTITHRTLMQIAHALQN